MDICGDILTCILAAKETDSREWLEFLPIIIIAVLWALGAILKVIRKQPGQQAQATKDERGSEQEPDLSKLVQLARERYMAAQRPAQQAEPKEPAGAPAVPPVIPEVPPTGREMPPPVPGARRARRVFERSPLPRPAARPATQAKLPALHVEIPSVEPDLEVLPEFATPMTKKLARPGPQPAGEELKEPRLTQILSEYSAPESLKRAILHYEILGKCAAMRQGHGTGMWS